uniref:Family with sequence similarity 53, member B n=1 Tax=Peromyscus maniculatus bairdii TaxID=230844 RepID=A0A8C8ULX0_PERMB
MVMILRRSLIIQGADSIAHRTFIPELHTPKKMSQGPTLLSCGIMELSDLQQPQLPERGDGRPQLPEPLRPRQQYPILDRIALSLQPRGQDPRGDPGSR